VKMMTGNVGLTKQQVWPPVISSQWTACYCRYFLHNCYYLLTKLMRHSCTMQIWPALQQSVF